MKIDKTGIWRGTLSAAIVLLVVVALSSCTKEPLSKDQLPSDVLQLKIALPEGEVSKAATDPGTPSENLLENITVLIFSPAGELETKLSISNLTVLDGQPYWENDKILLVPIKNLNKPKRIYAIANWTKEIPSDYTEAQLKAEQATTSEAVKEGATSLCMSGSKLDVDLKTSAYFVTVDIARQVAKFRAKCTMTKASQDKFPNVTWLYADMKIAMGNVPARSYIVEQSAIPERHNLLNSKWFKMNVTSSAGGNYAWDIVAGEKYIFENLVAGAVLDPKKTTYIIVQLPYQNKTTELKEEDNYYKLYVNDTESPAAPHSVRRNTIYQFNIELLGMGVPYNDLVDKVDNAEGNLTVIPWKDGDNIDVEDKPQYYFNIDRTLIGFQYLAEEQVVSIVTNTPQWSLVDSATNKVVLWTDNMNLEYNNDGLAYKLSGTPAIAKLTITKAAEGSAPTAKESFYFLVNKTLKVPFGVVYDNGFIPSSVLSQSFRSLPAGIIQGWPADRLPAHGLQIAKRGDQILPSGVAQADDPLKQWKIIDTYTSGTAKGVGMGKSSTNAMISAGADEHPAAKYCREMGPEWYLPSRDELLLIYNYKAALGSSYTFYADYYRSATAYNRSGSWSVSLVNGDPRDFGFRTSIVRVRCVREI